MGQPPSGCTVMILRFVKPSQRNDVLNSPPMASAMAFMISSVFSNTGSLARASSGKPSVNRPSPLRPKLSLGAIGSHCVEKENIHQHLVLGLEALRFLDIGNKWQQVIERTTRPDP